MSFDKYCHKISNEKVLSVNEQQSASKEELIKSMLRLVLKISHEFKGRGVHIDDLVQEGNIGLITAADKYDPNINPNFSTYAAQYIRMRMYKYINKNQNQIKDTHAHKNIISKIYKYRDKLGNDQLDPTHDQIAEELNISVKQVNNALATRVQSLVSFDQPIHDDSSNKHTIENILNIGDYILSPAELLNDKDNIEYISYLLSKLSDKERYVVTERFFNNKTLSCVADYLKISATMVKNIQDKSIQKLKSFI